MSQNKEFTKRLLESLYTTYSKSYKNDPIKFPRRYKKEGDIEIAGVIASAFAYGKVELFMDVIEKILKKMGSSPAEYIKNFNLQKENNRFEKLYYRFNKGYDIVALFYCLSKTVNEWGSLKNLFVTKFKESGSIKEALIQFIDEIRKQVDNETFFQNKSLKLDYLLTSPKNNSACKRMNMFLRWMVRDRDIDFGIWKEVGKEHLIIPIDTHVARISRCLGLLNRKSNDWKAAEELTQSLKAFDPADPVKYDFALCHVGIDGICNINNCADCKLIKIIQIGTGQ